jgi:peptidoglycan-N-acetylglucosamine deacetylase
VRFFRTPFLLPIIYPSLVWRIKDAAQKELFLTFDDGPVPGPTEFVLGTLKSFNVKATFFCIGDNVRKHGELYARVIDEGHVVANHTFNHVNGWKTDTASYVANINECDDVMAIRLKQSPGLFRPPFGRITKQQIKRTTNRKIIMWDVLTFDYDRSLQPVACLEGSLKARRTGSIIVFHDSLKAEPNMSYTLPRFIDQSLKEGYIFNVIK